MELLDKLNEIQAAAVQHKDGPLLILSGAGSGKTRVITHRIAYMLTEHGISPDNILAVTFTRKAAQEMKQRLIQLIGNRSRRLQISTIHSACYRILRENIHHHERLNFDNVVDFDDLIKYTIKMFQEDSQVLEKYQDKFQYIMVDEYQDTDESQYCLINMLAQKYRNLCVVGDDDQSIYAFRGADITNILNFEDDYPDALVLKLTQNYRSTKTIVDAANSIIQKNDNRKDKVSWTANDKGEHVHNYEAASNNDEADYVLRRIQEYVAAGYSYSDCAVLYRVKSQAFVFEDLFRESAIPHKIVENRGFAEQPVMITDPLNEELDAISMMTIHSSKGLEFPIVFLVGVQEGLMPHRMAIEERNVEEERRLCYVGFTRAEKLLHISYAPTHDKIVAVKSRFINDIPLHLMGGSDFLGVSGRTSEIAIETIQRATTQGERQQQSFSHRPSPLTQSEQNWRMQQQQERQQQKNLIPERAPVQQPWQRTQKPAKQKILSSYTAKNYPKSNDKTIVWVSSLIFLILFGFPILLSLVFNNESSQTQKSAQRIDVNRLANRNSIYVDGVLGSPSKITPITNDPSMMPGILRIYDLRDGGSAEIGFYRGKAKQFTVKFSNPTSSQFKAAERCGFSLRELRGLQRLPAEIRWTDVHARNIRYKRVRAIKDITGKYATFQAEVF